MHDPDVIDKHALDLVQPRPMRSTLPFAVWSAVRSASADSGMCGDAIGQQMLLDGSLAVAVVDIAGRGARWRPLAYYVATNVIALLTMQCRIEQVAGIVDRDFVREFPDRPAEFAGVFTAVIDPVHRQLRYFSAGHETAIVVRRDSSCQHLNVTGPAFGIVSRPQHSAATTRFEPGDDLIVVTDGITDGRDANGAAFGSPGVLRATTRAAVYGDDPARMLIDESVRHSVSRPDDRAAVVVSYPA